MLVTASVTDSLVTLATHVIRDLGLGGIVLLVGADAVGIPIPAGAVMLFAGFDVSTGHLTLAGILAAGIAGDVLGCAIAYWIGATGGHELLERHGGKLHLTPARVGAVHRWFERHGVAAIVVGRLTPLVRAYISYPAGVVRMRFGAFLAASAAGAAVVCVAFGLIGRSVGHRWTAWRQALGYFDYLVLVVVAVTAAYLLARRQRQRRRPADAAT
jgi:membrane protein DedA with SNARE-associated domain